MDRNKRNNIIRYIKSYYTFLDIDTYTIP